MLTHSSSSRTSYPTHSCMVCSCVQVVVVAAGHSPAQHTASLKKLGVAAAAGQQQQQQRSPVAFVAAAEALKLSEQQQHASCLQVLCQQVQITAASLLEQQQQPQPQGLTVLLDSLAVVWALAQGQVPQVQALLHSLAALGEKLQVSWCMEGREALTARRNETGTSCDPEPATSTAPYTVHRIFTCWLHAGPNAAGAAGPG